MSSPAGLAAIVESFTQHGFVVVRQLVPAQRAEELRAHLEERCARGQMWMSGDPWVPGTPSIFGDLELDHLMASLRPAIQACTGLTLHPTYTYARIYQKGDVLKPHIDRTASEIALSINLGQNPPDVPWALNLKGKGASTAALLMPGDVVLYRGMELVHWREPYEGNRMAQAFIFYVDANGPHAEEKLDRRTYLGEAYNHEEVRQ